MKRTLSLLMAMAITLPIFAQWTTSGTNIYNSNTGNVGIGTTTPNNKLTVHLPSSNTGNVITWGNAGGGFFGGLGFDANGSYLSIFSGTSGLYQKGSNGYVGIGTTTPGSLLTLKGSNTGISMSPLGGAYYGGIAFNREIESGAIFNSVGKAFQINNGGPDINLHFQVYDGSGTQITGNALVISGTDGSVGVNTASVPTGYKLAINGAAIATSMKVKLQANWPDFVFLKDYKLPTLTEVKTYIDKNRHLPDMPSADEVHANGLDLGEMNRLLLKKVEELTLYLMEEHERNAKQEARIEALEVKLDTLIKK